MKRLYTVIDFETTGLDAKVEQVTEIAAIKIDEDGNEVGRFHTFVNLTEGRKPSPYAKVTEEQCATGVGAYGALISLHHFVADTTVVAQYVPFDFSYLPFRPLRFVCTRALNWMLDPEENPSLGVACERLGIEVLDEHRAVDDVLMTIQLFLHQKKRAEELELDYENTVVDFQKRPLQFIPEHAKVVKEVQQEVVVEEQE